MAKLSKAPVFYTVAQVLHSPILKLDALIPELQDQLRREGFPGYSASIQTGFEVKVDAMNADEPKVSQKESVAHIFSSRDSTHSIVLREQSISYQTVEFDSMIVFERAFKKAIEVTSRILEPDSYTRIGMRLLDAVEHPDDDLTAYIRPEFLGLVGTLGDDWNADYTFTETLLTKEERRIKARVLSRSTQLCYPADLIHNAPPIPERFRGIDGVHAMIDSDAIFGGQSGFAREFNSSEILTHLKALKSDLSEVFKSIVTPKALEDWK
ncbi:TIGR04255 family protein [Stenotrophomonas maltophilia]|nr:TIGR04255 family protein [Stenotrophomonas maltophilia]